MTHIALSRQSNWPSELSIRAVRAEDAEALNIISNQPGFRYGTLRLPYQSLESTRQWLGRENQDDLRLSVLWEKHIIGHCGLIRQSGRRRHAAMLFMGLADEFTGKGIGSHLMQEIIDNADNWLAIRRIELTVYVDNLPAIRLYERFGFEKEGLLRQDSFRNGEYVDCYAMARLNAQ